MINYTSGDILNDDADILVNPVNTYGVMGKGLALAYKNKFPEMFEVYKATCDISRNIIKTYNLNPKSTDRDRVRTDPVTGTRIRPFWPGDVLWHQLPDGRFIANAATKHYWRNPSKLEWVQEILIHLRTALLRDPAKSIAIPPLGCGLGGLQWNDVRELIESQLKNLPNDILVYHPETNV